MKAIKSILFPVDLSNPSKQVAEYAITLAKAFDAQLTVLYVIPSLDQYPRYAVVKEFTENILNQTQQLMGDFVTETFTDPSVKIESKVLKGYVADVIATYAKENHIDLIVMATRQRTDLGRFFMGSVANRVIKSSPVPVFTLRPTEKK